MGLLREFFRKHKRCKSAYAKNATGGTCFPESPEAVQFCHIGACRRIGLIDPFTPIIPGRMQAKAEGWAGIAVLNDTLTDEEYFAFLERYDL